MKKLLFLAVTVAVGAWASGCGSSTSCGPGTKKEGGKCVPQCADGQYWDSAGAICKDIPACDTGTTFNPSTGKCEADITGCAPGTELINGRCVPKCGDQEYWDGTECKPVPTCDIGTTFNPTTGKCEANIDACAPGTHLENGECVPDVVCGTGTHAENGTCVADRLPQPDVREGAENNDLFLPGATPAQFQIPAVGQSVTLGGVIQAPFDAAGDGNLVPDFDGFVFMGYAGTYLRISSTSEGAALPTFLLLGVDPDTFETFYVRFSVNPNGLVSEREVYLPKDGLYILEITDYNNMINMLFGNSMPGVGGPDFSYFVTVTRLAAPAAVDFFLPHDAKNGDFNDGSLKFFSIPDLIVDDIVQVTSLGAPVQNETSDTMMALLVFGPDGTLLKDPAAENFGADVDAFFRAPLGGDYLVVQDFYLSIGPNKSFAIEVDQKSIAPADGQSHIDGDLPAGGEQGFSFGLAEGDFIDLGVYVDAAAGTTMQMKMFDSEMNLISEGETINDAGTIYPAEGFFYADHDTRVFVLVSEKNGLPSLYTMEIVQAVTPLLEAGQSYTGLGVISLIPNSGLPNVGMDHLIADAGQVVWFTGFNPTGFTTPVEQLYTPMLEWMGPAMALDAGNPVDAIPGISYIPRNGHYLHLVWDPDNLQVTGATYDTTVNVQNTIDAGAPVVGTDLQVTGQQLDPVTNYAFYTMTVEAGAMMSVTVTPPADGQLQPQVMGYAFGTIECDWWDCYLIPNPEELMMVQAYNLTAPAAGQPVVMDFVAPYDGVVIMAVANANTAGGNGEAFDILVHVTPPPENDTCAGAIAIDVSSGSATVNGDLTGARDDYDGSCANYGGGVDLVYSFTIEARSSVVAELIDVGSAFNDSVMYLRSECDLESSELACNDDGETSFLSEISTTLNAGTYFIIIDQYSDYVGQGPFQLQLTVTPL
jgi:hypothetical protein